MRLFSGFVGVLAMVLASCTLFRSPAKPGQILASVRTEIGKIAGRDSVACGFVQLNGDRSAALQCAAEAEAAGRAFHLAVQLQGIDSTIWSAGVWSPGRGKLQVWYDSDPSGGRGFRPRVRTTPCSKLELRDAEDEPIVCVAEEGPRK